MRFLLADDPGAGKTIMGGTPELAESAFGRSAFEEPRPIARMDQLARNGELVQIKEGQAPVLRI
ncbi:MAG: hypothetical protein ACR2LK_10835 [Solirubrobacteraceae bacterium]